jgi:RNA polymerase sigma-70 factor (ECF subfamily)
VFECVSDLHAPRKSHPAEAIDAALVDRLYQRANAERWSLPVARFAQALLASWRYASPAGSTSPDAAYLSALHLEDLALACACADGDDAAWEHFVREQRPFLYRAASAIDASGGARDLADSIYAELFGLRERDGARRSLFHYFHGRSSLTTWLRAILAQRHVDRLRGQRKFEPLPEEEPPAPAVDPAAARERRRYLPLIASVLAAVIARLAPRDRLRLACYYAQDLTLAETGRLLKEHEATASRQLTRTRAAIRRDVERELKDVHGLADAEVESCFESVLSDAGPLDLEFLLPDRHAGTDGAHPIGGKNSAADRSKGRG